LICFLSLSSTLESPTYSFTFDNDLDGMITYQGIWKWADRASLQSLVPAGGDGFAVYDDPGSGDTLFSDAISLQFGLNYSIKVFTSSKYEQGTTFALNKISSTGEFLDQIVDYTSLSSPINDQWVNLKGTIPPEDNAGVALFCQTNNANPDSSGFVWGCVVDELIFNVGSPTPTTPPPTTPTVAGTTPERTHDPSLPASTTTPNLQLQDNRTL
jgi:hypothetical protein